MFMVIIEDKELLIIIINLKEIEMVIETNNRREVAKAEPGTEKEAIKEKININQRIKSKSIVKPDHLVHQAQV